ncbi:MAG: hypothetical protein N2746_09710 [Deltaproteobacteria bacterium]|nr:hypothetical protein [Deltaproteobacteria bacterium]
MKRILYILVVVGLVIFTIIMTINRYYIPIKCIYSSEEECVQSATKSNSPNLLKRVCQRISEDMCISLLGKLHLNSMDSLIPFISDERCHLSRSTFCAFSSVAYTSTGDYHNAHKFAVLGCDLNEGVSCAILAAVELDNNKRSEALKTSLKGCLLNSAAACAIAGTILIEQGNEEEGIQFINRCCQLGGEDCCN